ncbi:MAG TPA: 50S ribosomal protein L32 [Clostridiaceae bacterium]|jgi:large subunit ribosomal protein L32|nr:50S ribosomal protein L32 [Clostridiaceae bacterium]
MAVPKRKWSKKRSRTHRANWKLNPVNLSRCPQCNALRMPHIVCKSCGYYNGREVVSVDDEK